MSIDGPQDPGRKPPGPAITTFVSRKSVDELAAIDEVVLSLVMVEGSEAGRRVRLAEKPITVGRDPGVDIVLADGDVSRLHCLVTTAGGNVVVEDLGSTNGTYVDGHRITTRAPLAVGSLLCVGEHIFRCERCSRRDFERAEEQYRDLQRAASYIQSRLPAPLTDGPLRTDWMLRPSARLGGDALGYGPIDDDTFAIYLIDVSGHGVSAAMLSVSVLNVLCERALPATDFRDPVQVLARLNAMFQMDRHDNQYFTMWYGVYDSRECTLTYATAGHHPGYLVPPLRDHARPLRTPCPVIGAMPEARFHADRTTVAEGSVLYVFSDGVFEVRTPDGQWRLSDFVPMLTQPATDRSECLRLYQGVRAACRPGPRDDDFSLLVVTFA